MILETAQTALAGFTIQQRIVGALLAILIWLAPAGAMWLYMRGQASAQYDLGKSACEADSAAAVVEDLRRFQDEQIAVALATKEQSAAIVKELATARARAAAITKEFTAYAKANPLPADCRADAERVRLYNESVRYAAPAP